MPDLTLKSLTALGASAPRVLTHGALTLAENPGLALASLALRRDAQAPRPFGLTLPGPGHWAAEGSVSAFWTGPDQWIIEGHDLADTDFAASLGAQAPGTSITEQTDGFAAFEINSTKGAAPVVAALSKLVNIAPERLAPGMATRTGLEHLSVFVIRRADDRLAVLALRSAAASVWHTLENAISRVKA